MAQQPKKVIKIGGGTRSGLDVAAQHKDDTRASVSGTPKPDDPPIYWAAWIQEAQGDVAAAYIEMGRRIRLAKDAYDLEPQRWGKTWESWCQQTLGISRSHAHKLSSIGEHLENSFHGVKQILPADTAILYGLARLKKDHPDGFDREVEAGTISADLTRKEMTSLLKQYYPEQQKKKRTEPDFVSIRVSRRVADNLAYLAREEGVSVNDLLVALIATTHCSLEELEALAKEAQSTDEDVIDV